MITCGIPPVSASNLVLSSLFSNTHFVILLDRLQTQHHAFFNPAVPNLVLHIFMTFSSVAHINCETLIVELKPSKLRFLCAKSNTTRCPYHNNQSHCKAKCNLINLQVLVVMQHNLSHCTFLTFDHRRPDSLRSQQLTMTTAANGSSSEMEDLWANAKTPGNFGEYGMSSVRTPGHYDPYSSPGAYHAVTEEQGQHDENAMDEDLIDNDPPDNSNINVTTPAWFGGSPVARIDNGDNAAYSREAIYEQMELDRNANHMHAARTPTYITARTPRVPFTSQDESTHGFHNNSYGDPYGSATKNYDHDDGSSLMDASLITHSGQTRKFKTTARSRHVPACANDYGTDPDSLTAELGSVSAATGTIPPLSFSPRKLPSSHPAANMPSNGMHIPEMLPAPSSSSFGTPPGKPAGRGRGAKKQMPGVPKKIKKAPARRSAAAKALLADDEDEDDDDDDNDGIVNMDEEETPSSKKKGKGKGQGKGRKSTAVPKTPKERIRKVCSITIIGFLSGVTTQLIRGKFLAAEEWHHAHKAHPPLLRRVRRSRSHDDRDA